LLDIKAGRASLAKLTSQNGYGKDVDIRIPVTVKGFITHRHRSDDGVSIEYGVEVTSLKIAGCK